MELTNSGDKRRYNPLLDEAISPPQRIKNRRRPRGREGNLEKFPIIIDDRVTTPGFPSPQPYTPIKKTQAVNKVYKTY